MTFRELPGIGLPTIQAPIASAKNGTAYLLCPEATVNEMYRTALKCEPAQHAAVKNVFRGRPVRAIINRITREHGPMSTAEPKFPLALSAVVALRNRAEARDSRDFSYLWCGRNSTGCKEIPAALLTWALTSLADGVWRQK